METQSTVSIYFNWSKRFQLCQITDKAQNKKEVKLMKMDQIKFRVIQKIKKKTIKLKSFMRDKEEKNNHRRRWPKNLKILLTIDLLRQAKSNQKKGVEVTQMIEESLNLIQMIQISQTNSTSKWMMIMMRTMKIQTRMKIKKMIKMKMRMRIILCNSNSSSRRKAIIQNKIYNKNSTLQMIIKRMMMRKQMRMT